MRIPTALALLLLLPATPSAQELDKAVSALVRISGTRGDTPVRGSGFVVGLDRDKAMIVTASHVVEGVQQLKVTFAADVTEPLSGDVLVMDSGNPNGLAVLQVRGALPAGVTSLSFEIESRPGQGTELFLAGFPQMELTPLTPRRVLSGRRGTLLMIDQDVGEGFSGGPVLRGGKVVGVVTDTDGQTTYAVDAFVAHLALEGWGIKLGEIKPSPPGTCAPGEKRTENGIVFVRICPGTFTMGSAENDPHAQDRDDEKPAHQVTLSEFWIGETEITNEEYRSFRPDHTGEADLPVAHVNWFDAKEACEYFGGRLPTEAEWEYAARAGSQTTWSFGDDEKMLGEHAWYEGNSGYVLHPVARKKPNDWGLYDMHGNVWEWVADWDGRYSRKPQTDPPGPPTGIPRVVRGGSIFYPPTVLRAALRNRRSPKEWDRDIGFRCVLGPRQSRTSATDTAAETPSPPPIVKMCTPGEERTENGIVFVRICPGTFTMGNDNGYDDEKPVHRVTLSEFWIGKTEVTNEQYRRFLPDHQGEPRLPVADVSWNDSQAACKYFGGRLPTEAEWEYAARAGSQTTWSFGDNQRSVGEHGWYAENSGHKLHPVGTKKANAWGLNDMLGNAREWVADWFGPYSGVAQTDPTGPTSGEARVLRGGSINYSSAGLRSSYRRCTDSSKKKYKDAGFRCVRGSQSQP